MSINIIVSAYFSYSNLARPQISFDQYTRKRKYCLCVNGGVTECVLTVLTKDNFLLLRKRNGRHFSGEKASTPGSLI